MVDICLFGQVGSDDRAKVSELFRKFDFNLSGRMMGLRSAESHESSRFGTKRTSVFDLLDLVLVCICSPNRLSGSELGLLIW